MPFAPVILDKFAKDYIKNLEGAEFASRFMTISFSATEKMKKSCPAAVHVDGTIRPQILHRQDNQSFYKILEEYYKRTGIPVLINTSFNIHEEPIVMNPNQAINGYLKAKLDCLAIGNCFVL
jgi:carbamoyltransferase